MRLRLVYIFEGCRLGLHFEHASACNFTLCRNRCFLQARCLYFRFLSLNWLLLCGPVASLHVLFDLRLRNELPAALLERAGKLLDSRLPGLICCILLVVLFLTLAGHSKFFAAEF